jgi:hypothetical protein
MSKTRIAVFEGYGRPPRRNRRYGAPLFQNPRMMGYGAPLFQNPRMSGYGFDPRTMPRGMGFDPRTMPQGMGSYGRRGYYVDPIYGPAAMPPGRKSRRLRRKGYHVKKGRNTKAQVRFKKAAKKCARKARGRHARKGTYQSCMRKALRKRR